MDGNVWEWCQDTYHPSYEKAPRDGTAWIGIENDNNFCLLRGGSWYDIPEYCRSASRVRNSPDDHYVVGFRVVCGAAQRILSS